MELLAGDFILVPRLSVAANSANLLGPAFNLVVNRVFNLVHGEFFSACQLDDANYHGVPRPWHVNFLSDGKLRGGLDFLGHGFVFVLVVERNKSETEWSEELLAKPVLVVDFASGVKQLGECFVAGLFADDAHGECFVGHFSDCFWHSVFIVRVLQKIHGVKSGTVDVTDGESMDKLESSHVNLLSVTLHCPGLVTGWQAIAVPGCITLEQVVEEWDDAAGWLVVGN